MNASQFGLAASIAAATSTLASGGSDGLHDLMSPESQEAAVSHRPRHRSVQDSTSRLGNLQVLAGGGRILPWQMGFAADQARGGVVDLQGTLQDGGAPWRPMLGPTGVEPDPLAGSNYESDI